MSTKTYSKVLTEEDSELLKVWKGNKDYHVCMKDAQESLVEGVYCDCGCKVDRLPHLGLCDAPSVNNVLLTHNDALADG